MNAIERLADRIQRRDQLKAENKSRAKDLENLEGFSNRMEMFIKEKHPGIDATNFDEFMKWWLIEFEEWNEDLEFEMTAGNLGSDVLCQRILGREV